MNVNNITGEELRILSDEELKTLLDDPDLTDMYTIKMIRESIRMREFARNFEVMKFLL